MNLDVWIGAGTTLLGAVLGGAISFVLSRQQIKAGRAQQEADRASQLDQRNAERRLQVYSDFLIRSRSLRNALKSYYLPSAQRQSLDTIDELFRSAEDTAALVFLLLESEEVDRACVGLLRALGDAQAIVHGLKPEVNDPWRKLNLDLGRAMRAFQVAARRELGVAGPTRPWDSDEIGERHADARLEAALADGPAPAGTGEQAG